MSRVSVRVHKVIEIPNPICGTSNSLKPVLHNWFNEGPCMCCPVCGMERIKDPLLLIENSTLCSAGSGYPILLTKWSLTICPTPYIITVNRMC